jgi:hypothetical protein
VILGIGASLQQEPVGRIEDQDREGTVQLAVEMHGDLAGATEGQIPVIDQDHLLAGVTLRCALQGVGGKRRYESGTQG